MILEAPSDYLYNLKAMTSSEAKKLWRSAIKEHWNNQCVYCGSDHNLTLDHVRTIGYLGGLVKNLLTTLIFQKSFLGQLASSLIF
jgi:hypothetical protein